MSLEVVKKPMNLKIYMEIQQRRWFYYISFADIMVITKLYAGSMHIGADYPKGDENYLNMGLKITAVATETTKDDNIIWSSPP